jgi:hypothetical protein
MTINESVETRLNQILDDAIELADLGNRRVRGIAIARRIYADHASLIEELKEPWMRLHPLPPFRQ